MAKKNTKGTKTNGLWRVVLTCMDEEAEAEITLPFVPFPGLKLQLPWRAGNFAPIDEVYWAAEEHAFHCHFNAEDEE